MDAYQIIAIIIALIFYGSYFLKNFSLKKQGISANRLAKGEKPTSVKRFEYCLKAATFCLIIVQAVSIYNKALPLIFDIPVIRLTSLVMAFIGSIFFIIATRTMKNSWRAGIDSTQKTEFIQDGIYKYSRNPAFVGFDLFYAGLAFCFPNIFNVLLSACCIILLHIQITQEEKYLKTEFGKEYIDYFERVRRYI